MKKTFAHKKGQAKQEELRSEYRFDYRKSKPNRFASKMSDDVIAVVLGARHCCGFQVIEDREYLVTFDCLVNATVQSQKARQSNSIGRVGKKLVCSIDVILLSTAMVHG